MAYSNIIKVGDTNFALENILAVDGVVVDLSDKTVVVRVRDFEAGTYTDYAATIVSATSGSVKHQFTAADTTIGTKYVEYIVTYADSTVRHFPSKNGIEVVVTRNLGY
jgi:hypothetical protein